MERGTRHLAIETIRVGRSCNRRPVVHLLLIVYLAFFGVFSFSSSLFPSLLQTRKPMPTRASGYADSNRKDPHTRREEGFCSRVEEVPQIPEDEESRNRIQVCSFKAPSSFSPPAASRSNRYNHSSWFSRLASRVLHTNLIW